MQFDKIFIYIMFESDDWIFDDDLNNIYEKVAYSPLQNEERIPSNTIKRRKLDDCSASSFPVIKNSDLKWNITMDKRDKNTPCSSQSSASRGNLLLGNFQKNTSQEKCNVLEEINADPLYIKETRNPVLSKNNISSIFWDKESIENTKYIERTDKIESNKEVKLVRIFPGPAGLVLSDDNVSAISSLNRTKEVKNKTVNKQPVIDLCKSQDGKNLFDEEAWKFLLKDLPRNFFKEYGISVVKSRANASHCCSMKVKFMAGMLDYTDHNHDDPFIILKDSTGSIEGTVHRNILLSCPGVLEPNMVLLLHDVGLLKTTTHVMTNKYHILISRTNVLAIYSNKGRIEHMSHMEDTLSSIPDIAASAAYAVPASKDCSNLDESQTIYENQYNTSLQANSIISTLNSDLVSISNDPRNIKYESSKQTLHKENGNCVAMDMIFEQPKHSTTDSADSNINCVSFTTDCESTISGEQNLIDSSSLARNKRMQTSRIQPCELQTRNMNYLQSMKRKSQVNSDNKIKGQNSSQVLQKCSVDMKIRVENADLTTIFDIDTCSRSKFCADQSVRSGEDPVSCYDGIAHEAHRDLNLNMKCTSLVTKCKVKNSKSLISYFSRDNEYDSDDEILSQLDVDNVVVNTKGKHTENY